MKTRRLSSFALLISSMVLGPVAALAADLTFPRVPPTPPDKAEATFETLHGFGMELIAAEPLVASPVDMAYDEDGRAYVVEMRDYPYPEEKNAEPKEFPGTVRLLEDADGDGKFDKATIFADQLAWPTSVCCYRGGVFVAAAPDIWYFKDTDDNRVADVRRKVFTGFSRYNVQAIMNSLRWGLDNKIYGAAAGNGGTVRHAERPDDPLFQLSRRDFRFDPVTEKIEAIAGGERFGACFDDWGNRFLCNIRNPVQHVVLPLEYVQRNPHLVVPSLIHDCAESGDQLRVFRLSPPEPWRVFRAQRWAVEGAAMPRSELIGAGFWTSSSGVCVYRGAAYPPEFRGNVFIGEVAGNLVHRQVLTRDGATFKSRRADENTEFVRSRDNWFRPVNFVNAPDGTLHVLDMYRETIEHPWSIPDDIKAKLDLASGKDRGRIYRLTPRGFTVPRPPRLSRATTTELVASLQSPHGWWRETAQRLLFERQDRVAVEPLRQLSRKGELPQSRLHAFYLLHEFDALNQEDALAASMDPHSEVRRNAIKFAAPFLEDSPELQHLLYSMAHRDAPARLQLALSMGHAPRSHAIEVLREVSHYGSDDPWTRQAILASSLPIAREMIDAIDGANGSQGWESGGILIRELARFIGSEGDTEAMQELIERRLHYAELTGLGDGLRRRNKKLSEFVSELPEHQRTRIDQMVRSAKRTATHNSAKEFGRVEMLNFLSHFEWEEVKEPFLTCLDAAQPRVVHVAAMQGIRSFSDPTVADGLVDRWKAFTPPMRDEAVGILLSRAMWHERLIAALEDGVIPVGQVSIPHRGRLAGLPDKALADRAKVVLASVALGPRKEVIDRYQSALSLKGNAENGRLVYRRECANCHRLGGEGHDVGPSLETVQHRSPQEILIHVLDPGREVSPQFLDYAVRLTDGRVLTGMIASEADAGLTLRRAEKQEETILRSEIEEITSSGKSLMPDGMEQKIKQEEMADLIAYLTQRGT